MKANNRKEARKQSQIIATPSLLLGDSKDAFSARSLNVSRFVDARAQEIKAMTDVLQRSKEMSKSRAFQKVARYLRRRAASHNPKKVPVKLRKQAMLELERDPVNPKKQPPKRLGIKAFFRSKRSTAFKIRSKRSGTWLETHVWHAKRFHMAHLWGYKLPLTPTQKCARSFYRAFKYSTVAFDTSYFSTITLNGIFENVLGLIKSCIEDCQLNSEILSNPLIRLGKSCFQVVLLNDKHEEIAPIKCVYAPNIQKMFIRIHPLALNEAMQVLSKDENIPVSISKDISEIQLYGAKCVRLLHSVLKISKSSKNQVKWENIKSVLSPACFVSGSCISLTINDPRIDYPPSRPNYLFSNQDINLAQKELDCDWNNGLSIDSLLWNCEKSPKLTDLELNSIKRDQNKKKIVSSNTECLSQDIPLFILFTTYKEIPGLSVLIPKEWILPLWRSLVWAGARPGGIHQMRDLYHENGIAMYPFDYPQTVGYNSHMEIQANQAHEQWKRRPPAKRVNYVKIGIENPFKPNWKLFDNKKLYKVILKFEGRGNAQPNAVIYRMPNNTVCGRACFPSSEIIGYATTGRYSLKSGKTCLTASIIDSNCEKVLVQPITRKYAYPALVKYVF